jgi:predicted esterase
MKKVFLLVFYSLMISLAFGQNVYHFTRGLFINAVSRYGREAIYTDHLAYNLFTSALKSPVAGDSMMVGQSKMFVKWQEITADSTNRLRARNAFGFGGGGYIYLTYTSEKEQTALLNIKGNSAVFVNKELHAGDPYASGWFNLPIVLKKGLNEFYVRGSAITADLVFPEKAVHLNTDDPTLPFVVKGAENVHLMGAVVVINTQARPLYDLQIKAKMGGQEVITTVPSIPALSTRKVAFHFNGSNSTQIGNHDCFLQLVQNGRILDEKSISIEAVEAAKQYASTFVSNIDGSVQYFAVAPQTNSKDGSALFLSVHGAGVEAIGQARAYQPKDWGTLVAATNRRPRGFNWEDWGRLDALEVLRLAKDRFKPDPKRIYLTGHSMGGHGTWFLGATYPDHWAGIAPCAGYPTLKEYGSADGKIPDSSRSAVEQMLLRASNQSDVLNLVNNYKPLGVYILHGDSDKVVSVDYARQMKKALANFHPDISYYEYPGGSHWYGNESVDWKPIFDFFKWHQIAPDSSVHSIDFITSSPGISPSYRWASIQQQIHPLQYSRIQLNRNVTTKTITGKTENVLLLKLDLSSFGANNSIHISLDDLNQISYTTVSGHDSIYLHQQDHQWRIATKPSLAQKGPHRYGTFKDAFHHKMIFVYGTTGTSEENKWSLNKARYDAETWYYRGNGSVDVIADKDFSLSKYKDRNVIVYGNANTNGAYKLLLQDCPIQIERNLVKAGNQVLKGDDLGTYFVWPIKGSSINSVGVIGGTGLKGMNAAFANQYFAGGSGFPDFMIFRLGMLQSGAQEVKMAGYFNNEWKLSDADMIQIK